MVHKFIVPKMMHGGAWRSTNENKTIAVQVERCIRRKIWYGRSPAMMWVCDLGPDLHPDFAQDWCAISVRVRRLRQKRLQALSKVVWGKRHAWQDVPIVVADGRIDEVAERWGWTRIGEDKFQTPDGILDLTRDGKACIKEHAIGGWQQWMFSNDNRGGFGPVGSQNDEPVLDTHLDWWTKRTTQYGADSAHIAGAAIGCTPDYRSTSGQPSGPCPCGEEQQPTRRHWTWRCKLRQGRNLPRPRCEIEEGLCTFGPQEGKAWDRPKNSA